MSFGASSENMCDGGREDKVAQAGKEGVAEGMARERMDRVEAKSELKCVWRSGSLRRQLIERVVIWSSGGV